MTFFINFCKLHLKRRSDERREKRLEKNVEKVFYIKIFGTQPALAAAILLHIYNSPRGRIVVEIDNKILNIILAQLAGWWWLPTSPVRILPSATLIGKNTLF